MPLSLQSRIIPWPEGADGGNGVWAAPQTGLAALLLEKARNGYLTRSVERFDFLWPGCGSVVKVNSLAPYLWMLSSCFFFAFMSFFAQMAGQFCPWQLIAFTRSLLALLFSLLLAWWNQVPLVVFAPRVLWIRSLAGSVAVVCTFYALTQLPVSAVLTLTHMFPLWLALLSWPLDGKAPPQSLWLSLASGIIGVALVQQPHIAVGNWGIPVALFSSFFSAVAMLGLNRIKGVDSRAIVVHFSGMATLFTIAAFLLLPNRPVGGVPGSTGLTLPLISLLLAVGVMATLGQLSLTRAFSCPDPTGVSVVSLTQIVIAMILDRTLLGHPINLLTLVGTAMIIIPTAFIMLRQNRGGSANAV